MTQLPIHLQEMRPCASRVHGVCMRLSEISSLVQHVTPLDCNKTCIKHEGPTERQEEVTEGFRAWALSRKTVGWSPMFTRVEKKYLEPTQLFWPTEAEELFNLYKPLVESGAVKDVLMTGGLILSNVRPLKDIDVCLVLNKAIFEERGEPKDLPVQLGSVRIDTFLYFEVSPMFAQASLVTRRVYVRPGITLLPVTQEFSGVEVVSHPVQYYALKVRERLEGLSK